ncbi:MAG: hypothetical protein Hens3KO_11460 [Henriciella sp.]
MIEAYRRRRQQSLIILAGIAALLWVIIGISALWSPSQDDTHAQMGEPVLKGFAETRAEAQQIRFIMADDNYTLSRTANGWVMEESGRYPIRADRLSDLASGLEGLTFDKKRTNDPYKLDQIGLGDPAEGGTGVLIEVLDPNLEVATALMVGRKGDRIYTRAPGSFQTYRTSGDLPPFYNRRAWLDFDIIDIDPSAIRSVRISDASGESLYLSRLPGSDGRSFRPAPPNQTDRLVSRLAASTTALAITRLAALDVKPASDLVTPPIARHISETFDGLEIDLSAYREPDGVWITFRAVEAGEGARRAENINDRAEGWAFRLSDYDFQDFTPAVSSLVTR